MDDAGYGAQGEEEIDADGIDHAYSQYLMDEA